MLCSTGKLFSPARDDTGDACTAGLASNSHCNNKNRILVKQESKACKTPLWWAKIMLILPLVNATAGLAQQIAAELIFLFMFMAKEQRVSNERV